MNFYGTAILLSVQLERVLCRTYMYMVHVGKLA